MWDRGSKKRYPSGGQPWAAHARGRLGRSSRDNYAASRLARNSSSSRATLLATERSVGVHPSARARTAHDLVQRERISIGAHRGPRFINRHVPYVGLQLRLPRNGFHDVRDPLIGLVVGVVDPRSIRVRGDAEIQVGEISVVDARPVIPAIPNDPDEAVGGVFQQVCDDPARPP